MTKELAGKIAFVTGSGRGLGRVMAERLAELGADVAIHDLTWTGPAKYGEAADLEAVAKQIARHGGRVAAVSGNIGDKAAVATMKEEIEAKLGSVDILVNCAGGDIGAAGGKPDPNDALGIALEDIRALTENNLYGTILVCQAFVPPMVKAGSGSVINIGSAAAQFGVTNGVIYAALKAAVIHYTRCLAASVRTEGVCINAVSPGSSIRKKWIRRSSRSSAMESRTRWPTRSPSSLGPEANISAARFFGWTAAKRCFRDDERVRARTGVWKVSDAKRFEGMTAVVTGGASGIGLGVAKRIASEGGRVTIWDMDPARLKAAVAEVGGNSARADEVNVADPKAVEKATLIAAGEMGHIDILVCSAGVAGKNALVIDFPIDEWKRVFDINVHGLFYCNRFVAKLMKHRGYGRIVTIASIAGKEGNPTASAYSASKAAVIGLTKSLGKELAKDGVCVNTITPATIDTPILSQVSDAHIAYMRSKIPMERFGTVEEATAIVCWLASRECSFTTGAVFDLSGGRATY